MLKPNIPAIVRTIIRLREHKDVYPPDAVELATAEYERIKAEHDGEPYDGGLVDLMADIMISIRTRHVDDD